MSDYLEKFALWTALSYIFVKQGDVFGTVSCLILGLANGILLFRQWYKERLQGQLDTEKSSTPPANKAAYCTACGSTNPANSGFTYRPCGNPFHLVAHPTWIKYAEGDEGLTPPAKAGE